MGQFVSSPLTLDWPVCHNEALMQTPANSWWRNPWCQIGGIGICIMVLGVLSFYVPPQQLLVHDLLHHLNFLPLMVTGMLFGWRGAIIGLIAAFAIQVPTIVSNWIPFPNDARDQILEVSIFGAAGIIAGFLADRERAQRSKAVAAAEQLAELHGELQRNVNQVRKAERLSAAGQLAASLAHEIRNPLAGIAGAAGILKRGHASAENRQECLEIIEKESHRLDKLLSGFLDFARPRLPRLQPTEVGAVVRSVAQLAQHSPILQSVDLRIEIASNLPEVECDPEQMKQVLLNLLINAAQASSASAVHNGSAGVIDESQLSEGIPLVWLRAFHRGPTVYLEVEDRGCGIDPTILHEIFDPFFTTKTAGTGLGLSIASMVMQHHGGSLTGSLNASRGMTFRLELPAQRTRYGNVQS